MESLEVKENGVESCNGKMESLEVRHNGVDLCNGGSVQLGSNVGESDHLDVDILEDLESYMQDVNDRLTISRMVSDSIVKGMVNAVTEEAAEKVSQKVLEVTELKEMLQIYHMGIEENEFLGSRPRESNETQHGFTHIRSNDGVQPSYNEAVAGHDRIAESLVLLRGATHEQFKKLKKEIDSIRGCNSVKRISSSSGLGDILQDKASGSWDVDRTLDSFKSTIESVYQQVDKVVHLSKTSVYEWHQDQEFKAEVEAEVEEVVMRNCIWGVEEKNSDYYYGATNVNWHVRMKEISRLRDELDAISKSLSVCDIGQLSSHGSLEGEEESSNGKWGHRNLRSSSSLPSSMTAIATTLSPSASSLASLCEENGIHDESKINMEEQLDPLLLKHMSREELISHCKNEITKLKRNHELKVQDLTEQHFSHRRELLRERGPSLTPKKNKEFDMLRRMSEVISKIHEILVEDEEVATSHPHTFSSNEESLSSLKDRLESLLSENHQLADLLEDKKRQIECLSLQVSEAAETMSQHSLAEAKLSKTTANLEAAMEDARIEALIGDDIFSGILREVVDEIKCIAEESQLENSVMHDINKRLEESCHSTEPGCELEYKNMESIMMQEIRDVIVVDALKDAEEKLNDLNIKYTDECERRVLHEKEKQEKQKQLEVEIASKERLKQEILALVEEKEQLARDAAAALANESERYKLATQELENLRSEACDHQKLISESCEELNAAKRDLFEALDQIEKHNADICNLERKLELVEKELREIEEERMKLLNVIQEKQTTVSISEAKERELKEKFESIAVYVSGLLKSFADFEHKVTQDISGKCSRLKSLTCQLHLLQQKADVLVRRGLLYKQRFEKKCSDLEKAEAEVDLLGDEVETLLNLVEKIYIALDHYSPILQHYPGISEILKLVRRELSAEIKSI